MEGGCGFVGSDAVAALASFFADGVVGEDLPAHLGDARNIFKVEAIRLQSAGVEADHECQVATGRMSPDENLPRVAAHPADVPHRPREGCGRIIDILRVLGLRAEAVIRHDHGNAFAGKARRDFGAVFRSEGFTAVLQPAAIEPNIGGKGLVTFCRQGDVQFTAFGLVSSEVTPDAVDDVLADPEVGSGFGREARASGDEESQAEGKQTTHGGAG